LHFKVIVVIACPYCQNSIMETESECPQCGIDGEKLVRIMGPMPVIFGGVTQDGKLLSDRQVKRLRKVTDQYQRRFPQCRLHLMVRSFPQEMEFSVILFWIFNQAGLSSQESKGGQNRDVVILVEPRRAQAGLIVGYGLEPLLSQEAMDEIVAGARGELVNQDFAGAFEVMVDRLTNHLREISLNLPEAVGLQAKLAVDESNDY
jgi:hypothetical protein